MSGGAGSGDVSTPPPTQHAWYMSTSAGQQVALDCLVHVYGERMSKESYSAEEQEAIVLAVLEGMASGRTVADTAREWKVKPGTVRKWLARDPVWWEEYRRMRPLLGAAFAEEAIRVARESSNATSAQDRTLIDTLKWAAAKAAPMEYGDKQVVEHQGQQTLQVKVLEDNAPVRNVQALKEAVVSATLANTAQIIALPAPSAGE
jgi:transposase-like protein